MSKYRCVGTVGMMWGNLPRYFANAYKKMMSFNNRYLVGPGEYIHEVDGGVSWHEAARNQMVQDSRGEWLLMLDTDHTFAPDMLERLLYYKQKHGCRIINGIYQYKFAPHAPVANLWTSDGAVASIVEWPKEAEVLQIGSCGAGCLLVDRSVFKEITEKTGRAPFDIISGLSEDYSFFKRCKDLDIPVHLTPRVECHHVIDHVLDTEDYQNPYECVKVKVEDGKVIEAKNA